VSYVSETLTLTIVFEEGEDGFVVASVPQVPGVLSQGRTRAEARANVIDALRLMLRPDPPERGRGADSESLQLLIDQ
jgi:predicted RNase H-like HicB family nuclease